MGVLAASTVRQILRARRLSKIFKAISPALPISVIELRRRPRAMNHKPYDAVDLIVSSIDTDERILLSMVSCALPLSNTALYTATPEQLAGIRIDAQYPIKIFDRQKTLFDISHGAGFSTSSI